MNSTLDTAITAQRSATGEHHELVHGRGWVIVDADDMEPLQRLRENVIDEVNRFDPALKLNSIEEFRAYLTTQDDARVNKIGQRLIAIDGFAYQFQSAFRGITRKLAGEDIFLQRRSHIMFNVPGNIQPSMQHIDAMSGISPYSFIIWTPLHDIVDDSGVYLIDQQLSMAIINRERKNGYVMGNTVLDMQLKPIPINYGQAVIFNPFVMHGSIPNTHKLARIGITNRFQSQAFPLFVRHSEFFYPVKI